MYHVKTKRIKVDEDMAAAEGVYHFHTYSRNAEGELILDADLLAEVGGEEDLFDEDYEEEEITENRSDSNLRNEHISKEEVAELLADAEEHGAEIEASDSEDESYNNDNSKSQNSEESEDDVHSTDSENSEEESNQESNQDQYEEQNKDITVDEQVEELEEELCNKEEDQGNDNSGEKIEFLRRTRRRVRKYNRGIR